MRQILENAVRTCQSDECLFVDCPCIQNAEKVHAFLMYIMEGCQMLNALFGAALDGDAGYISGEGG